MPVQKSKLLIILRGLPATGKTHLARNYLINLGYSFDDLDHTVGIPILSSDDFFTSKDGKENYKFDKDQLGEAHKWNFERFKVEVSKQSPLIIIDNTNIKNFHYYHYLDYGQRNGYLVVIMIIPANNLSNRELAEKNLHGVNQETIRRMRNLFEWKTEEK